MAKAQAQRGVRCYHCRHRFSVGAKTQSTVCPSCNKSLVVEDVVVTTLKAIRKVQTCGKVVVQKKGHIIASLVDAGEGVEVVGVMEASVVSGGPVRIGKTARWKGDCRAPALAAELGCVITSGFFEIQEPAPEDGAGEAAAVGAPSG